MFLGRVWSGGLCHKNGSLYFPGRGAQYIGMGRDLYAAYPQSKEVFDKADKVLGFSISSSVLKGRRMF